MSSTNFGSILIFASCVVFIIYYLFIFLVLLVTCGVVGFRCESRNVCTTEVWPRCVRAVAYDFTFFFFWRIYDFLQL